MGWVEDEEVLLAGAAEQLAISDEYFKRYMIENKSEIKSLIHYDVYGSDCGFCSPFLEIFLTPSRINLAEFMLQEFNEDIDVTSYLWYDRKVAFGPEQKDTLKILMKHHSFRIQEVIEGIYDLPSIALDILGLILGQFPWKLRRNGAFKWVNSLHQKIIENYINNPIKVYKEMRLLYYREEDASQVFCLCLLLESKILK